MIEDLSLSTEHENITLRVRYIFVGTERKTRKCYNHQECAPTSHQFITPTLFYLHNNVDFVENFTCNVNVYQRIWFSALNLRVGFPFAAYFRTVGVCNGFSCSEPCQNKSSF